MASRLLSQPAAWAWRSIKPLERDVPEEPPFRRTSRPEADRAGAQARVFPGQNFLAVQQDGYLRPAAFHDDVMGFAPTHFFGQGHRLGKNPFSVMAHMRPQGVGPGLPFRHAQGRISALNLKEQTIAGVLGSNDPAGRSEGRRGGEE